MIGATTNTTRSLRAIARLFGASSPTTTCRSVMIEKAIALATPMPTILALSPNTGSRMWWKAGSPSAPRPRLEIVMPSWHAAR